MLIRYSRLLLVTTLALGSLVGTVGAAIAQEFPNRQIRVVVPFPPGGSTDIWARVFGDKLRAKWGQTVVVENRAGAGGNVGSEFVARAAPDGYTLLFTAPGPLVINRSLFAKLSYDPDAFVPVSIVAANSSVLAVHPGLPVTSLAQLISYGKANPDKLSYGSAGTGSTQHLAGELLKTRAGIQMTHVPYKGNGPALTDLLGGQIQVMFVELSTALPHIRTNKLRPLAVGNSKRTAFLPDVPAAVETLPGVVAISWIGMVAPSGTPLTIANRISAALNDSLKDADVVKRMADLNVEAMGMTPAAMAVFLKEDAERWGAIIRASGARAE